ncbi:uncharacterized protein LOC116259600 [Nymphaea colorata]|nr:uncharacterized protein LOC116259600 [Nymphaea colorata]
MLYFFKLHGFNLVKSPSLPLFFQLSPFRLQRAPFPRLQFSANLPGAPSLTSPSLNEGRQPCNGSSQMNWKERKKIEDQNVVSLGGKCGLSLSLSKFYLPPCFFLGVVDQIPWKYTSKSQKNRPEDQVLKISQGNFRNGVLNVKHILRKDEAASRVEVHNHGAGKEKKRGKKKQQKGRKRRCRS